MQLAVVFSVTKQSRANTKTMLHDCQGQSPQLVRQDVQQTQQSGPCNPVSCLQVVVPLWGVAQCAAGPGAPHPSSAAGATYSESSPA